MSPLCVAPRYEILENLRARAFENMPSGSGRMDDGMRNMGEKLTSLGKSGVGCGAAEWLSRR